MERNYWWLVADPARWSFSFLKEGEQTDFDVQRNGPLAKNFQEAKVGDKVVGYESGSRKQVVALCEVSAESNGESIYFRKIKDVAHPVDLQTLRMDEVLDKMQFCAIHLQGKLFRLTGDEFERILIALI